MPNGTYGGVRGEPLKAPLLDLNETNMQRRVQDIGCRYYIRKHSEHRLLITDHWILATDHCPLTTGYRPLITAH